MISDTSFDAWMQVQKHLGAAQKKVLDAIREEPATNAELAQRLAIPVNRITPRVHELRKLGLVEDGGKVKCKATGGTAHVWQSKAPLPSPFKEKPKAKTQKSLFAA